MEKIDNVKMWEYLIKQSEEYLIFCQIATWLKEALHEQGLEWNEEIRAIVSIKPEPLSPAPQRNNYDEIKQAEPKQENSPILSNSSNTAKNDELTEFELCLFYWLSSDTCGVLTNDSMRQVARNRAKELLSIARREIAEGIENDRIVMLNNHFADVPQEDRIRFDSYFYEEGIRDVVKKLKED